MKALIQLQTIQNDAITNAFYALGEVPDTIQGKIDYVARLSDQLDIQAKEVAKQIKELQSKKRMIENAGDNLDLFIKQEMSDEGMIGMEGDRFKFSLSDSQGSLLIDNEGLIPEEFFEEKIERVLNKEKLKAALTLGMVIEGASIKKGHRLMIKEKGE